MSVVAERGIDNSLNSLNGLNRRPEHAGHRRREPQAGRQPWDARHLYPEETTSAVRRSDRTVAHGAVRARVLTASEGGRVRGCSTGAGVRRWPALAALAIAVFAGVVGIGLFAGEMAAPVPESTAVVVVEPGQTVWGLAQRFAPGSESTAVVERIMRLNDLGAPVIEPGTPLVVPSAAPDTVP